MEPSYSGKRVLLIAPVFFGYEKEIIAELELAGARVTFHNERPASTPLVKALIRFRPRLMARYSDAYFDRIVAAARSTVYDVVLVIKGEALSLDRLLALRASQPQARFIYYTWDSLKNVKDAREKLAHFERAYSFDRHDAAENSHVEHLPLFYIRAYEKLGKTALGADSAFDLLFLGSIHSDRYAVVQRILQAGRESRPALTSYLHFFYQSRWVFAVRKVVDRYFRPIPWRAVRWDSLGVDATLDLIARSRVLIDIHHPGQTGLTMRTLECLGAHKKLVTTNTDITSYEFYHPANVLVVDRAAPVIPADFIDTPYCRLPDDIYSRYSVRTWLDRLFS